MRHRAPQWMLNGEITEIKCGDCGDHLRQVRTQTFCIYCWQCRTSDYLDHARRSLAELRKKRDRALQETLTHYDEANCYRAFEDEAIYAGHWNLDLEYKWRAAILEMTGKKLPMRCMDAA